MQHLIGCHIRGKENKYQYPTLKTNDMTGWKTKAWMSRCIPCWKWSCSIVMLVFLGGKQMDLHNAWSFFHPPTKCGKKIHTEQQKIWEKRNTQQFFQTTPGLFVFQKKKSGAFFFGGKKKVWPNPRKPSGLRDPNQFCLSCDQSLCSAKSLVEKNHFVPRRLQFCCQIPAPSSRGAFHGSVLTGVNSPSLGV